MLFTTKKIQPGTFQNSPAALPSDGFRIHFTSTGEPKIEASGAAGATYAANHLAELKERGQLPKAPVVLEDIPAFAERGFMLDISRDRVPTMETLFRLVDRLAKLRYNQLQLYTEHTFAFRNHKKVWKDASPMTVEEIRELEDYCRNRHIDLVPNQNCFGHMERWLRHPEYHHLAECPDGFEHPNGGRKPFGTTLHPSAESERFVEEILSEVLPVYGSMQANIGGDEPWELGQGRSRERAEAVGKHEVYLGFLEKIFAITERLGKEPVFWADIVLERPELVSRLPANAVPAIWGYHPDHPYAEQCRIVAEAGFRGQFQVVPGTNTWNSFTGRLRIAAENIRLAAEQGREHGARGLILTCWGDGGHHQSTASLDPSLILAARAAWRGDGNGERFNLAEEVDGLSYPDKPAGNGYAICKLGEVDDLLPYPNSNQSFLHSAFFASAEKMDTLTATTTPEALAQAEACLRNVDTEGLDACVALSRDMSLWAIERCRLHLGCGQGNEADLRNQLDSLRERFREVWLRDSRPGGLSDSLGRFPAPDQV